MTPLDQRITAALQLGAPPKRDPIFRLQVVELRERNRLRRRAWYSVASLTAVAVVSVLAIGAGGDGYTAGSILLITLVIVVGGVVHLPLFGRLIRQLSV